MKKSAIVCLLGALTLAIWSVFAIAQQATPNGGDPKNIKITWDAPTLNTDGSTCRDLGGYEMAVSRPEQDMNASGVALSIVDLPGAVPPTPTLEALAQADGEYRIWIRAYDLYGNRSAWSQPLPVAFDVSVPAAPTGLRITLILNPDGSVRWEPAP